MEEKQVYGRIWREDRESGPPERSQKIVFLSNTDPDPMKNRKDTKPEFNVRHHRDASETPFKWHFTGMAFRWRTDDGRLLVVFGSSLFSSTKKLLVVFGSSLLSSSKKQTQKQTNKKKKSSKLDPL